MHEAISIEDSNPAPAGRSHLINSHVEVQEVGPIAQEAGAKKLVLSHIGDLARDPLDPRERQPWAKQGYNGGVTIGTDLQRIAVIDK